MSQSRDLVQKAFERLLQSVVSEESLEIISKQYFEYIYETKRHNKCHTAAILGVDRRTIQRWAKGQKGNAEAA